jgi:hypothetical protein
VHHSREPLLDGAVVISLGGLRNVAEKNALLTALAALLHVLAESRADLVVNTVPVDVVRFIHNHELKLG